MTVKVIIGANLGDEGKGNMTDYFSRLHRPATVVRFNGGAQAGHTVVVNSGGPRHVFHHLGAGTFAGAETHLEKEFIFNPIMLMQELRSFPANGSPLITVHPMCYVTTPWDMYLNQAVERRREKIGEVRHGSCGVGINETIERSLTFGGWSDDGRLELPLRVDHLLDESKTRYLCSEIVARWVPFRASALQLSVFEHTDAVQWAKQPHVMERFIADCRDAMSKVNVSSKLPSGPLVYEGAQGLMLDQKAPGFPHLTRSNTGLDNVVESLGVRASDDVEVVYVTRAYLTRHGAGPLNNTFDPLPSMIDATNIRNEWQGSLRYAALNIDTLAARIAADFAKVPNKKWRKSVAVTCVDQIVEPIPVIYKGTATRLEKHAIVDLIEAAVSPTGAAYESCGPTAENVSVRKS